MCVTFVLPGFLFLAPHPVLESCSVPASTSLTSLFSSLCVCPVFSSFLVFPAYLSSGFLLSFLKILHGLPVSPGAERSFK